MNKCAGMLLLFASTCLFHIRTQAQDYPDVIIPAQGSDYSILPGNLVKFDQASSDRTLFQMSFDGRNWKDFTLLKDKSLLIDLKDKYTAYLKICTDEIAEPCITYKVVGGNQYRIYWNSKKIRWNLMDFQGIDVQEEKFSRTDKDHALFFAIKAYKEWGSLKNPVNDAEAIARVLANKYGFSTTIIKNPTKDEILQTIQQYLTMTFSDDEQLFIYFSGHGEFIPYPGNPDEGKGYFIPSDGKLNDPYRQSYLSWLDFLPDIDNIDCKHIMLVVDACYSGAILKGKSGRPDELPEAERFFNSVMPYLSRLVITSGGKERSLDGNEHSPLTYKLLEGFASNGGSNSVLSFHELFGFLQDIQPRPRNGYFGRNDPNSDFLFLNELGLPPPIKEDSTGNGHTSDTDTISTVTPIDSYGNPYPIINLVGKQWLGKNLNLQVPDSWCFDNDPAHCDSYGRLYTWQAAQKACSELGWRLPTDEEWRKLTQEFGASFEALMPGGRSGFNAQLGGRLTSDGNFENLGGVGNYWSATAYNAEDGWFYSLNSHHSKLERGQLSKESALSCRCVKDQ